MREWRVGDRVSSIATSYPGVGTIINVRFSDIEVRWPDGSWSRERPQDLIYGGRSEDPVTPLGAISWSQLSIKDGDESLLLSIVREAL